MDTAKLDRLTLARADLNRMRSALDLARQRAADAEGQRIEAEQKHANTICDAMLAGDKTPGKPASLSAIQSLDDSTSAALLIIENRVRSAEGEVHAAAVDLVGHAIDDLVERRHGAARVAAGRLVQAHRDLVAAIGSNGATAVLGEISLLPIADTSMQELASLSEIAPEAPSVADLYRIRCAEMHVTPSHAELADLLNEVRK